MKKMVILALAIFGLIGLFGCDEQAYEQLDYQEIENVGNFESYQQLKDYLDDFYIANESLYRMEGALDSQYGAQITTTVIESNNTTKSNSHSETNNQVEGVFESDRILTDGDYIYVLSDSGFFIVDHEDLSITDSYTYEDGYLYGIYKHEDHVVLLGQEYRYYPESVTYTNNNDEDYRLDYFYVRYEFGTRVMVFDISDKTDMDLEKEMYFEGSYLTDSRMIDGQVYLILNNYAAAYGYEDDGYIPRYYDTTADDDPIRLDAGNIYYMPNNYNSLTYMLLVSFGIETDEPADVKAYLGSTYEIYMSHDNLYTVAYRCFYDDSVAFYREETLVMRFAIEDGKLDYKSTAKVEGTPLNQFSMDEHEGYLRIATTGYNYGEGSWNISNKVTIFDATAEGMLEAVSVLSGLGKPDERIYAVRFSGDLAYVVTFVNTDPLYKLDLSDPESPVILGELYEEGVSDYLHEITDDLLLGVGRQAENIGGFTNFTGVKISLYDVTGNDPVTIETYFVDGEYSYSPVTYDHKAFVSYQPETADFMYVAIPVYEYSEVFFKSSQGVYVFKVTYSGDLEYLTRLSHLDANPDDTYYNYWDSIERTVMIGNLIYTVSYHQIRMFDMETGFTFLGKVILDDANWYFEDGTIPEDEEPVDVTSTD